MLLPSDAVSDDLLTPTDAAPPLLVLLIGLAVTPTVLFGFGMLRSMWITYLSLYYLWIVAPSLVCFCYSGSRKLVQSGLRRAMRRQRFQLGLAIGVVPLAVGLLLLGYHVLAPPLGIDEDRLKPSLGMFGLTPSQVFSDLGALAWLTFLNPFMEEFFWRVFVFEHLRMATRRWWLPCLITSFVYAMYHVPVVCNFLPLPLVALGFIGLVSLGVVLQVVVEHVGIIFSVGIHLAFDAVASLIVTDILWRWGLI